MGRWGSGNLDSDGAFEAMAERSAKLVQRVWSALRSTSSTEGDEDAHDALFLDLEWLLALDQAKLLHGWHLPKPAELDEALVPWLEAWSTYMDDLAPPAFTAERRVVIEETFARLREACVRHDHGD